MASYVKEDVILHEIAKILHDRDNWACRKSFKMLYSAKDSGKCDPKEFHEKCDNIPKTVTLLIGKNGVGFGGYAEETWSVTDNFKRDDLAFLFRKCPHESSSFETFNVMANGTEWALLCREDYGPCFGGGRITPCDLMAFKKQKRPLYNRFLQAKEEWEGLCVQHQGIFKLNGTSKIKSGVFGKSDTNLDGDGLMEVMDVRVYQVEVNENPVWRNIPTANDKRQDFEKKLEEIRLKTEHGVNHLNILLIGSSRAGKSSFCNTLSAILTSKLDRIAETGSENSSVTNKMHCYKLVCNTNEELEIHVTDIRGYEEDRGYDFELDKILDGELKPGYSFDDTEKPVDDHYLRYLTRRENAIHAVCFVTDITQKHSEKLRKQFQKIKKRIRKRGEKSLLFFLKSYDMFFYIRKKESDLPVIGIATKMDTFCEIYKQNLAQIYKSPKCEHAVKSVALDLEIQANAVFPIVNYTSDEYVNKEKVELALIALHFILEKTIVHIVELNEWKEMHDDKDIWYNRNEQVSKLTVPQVKNELLQSIKSDENLRILCVGKPNAGKSAFIDSILSAASEEISNIATGGFSRPKTDDISVPATEIFRHHQLKLRGEKKGTGVYFCDMPGMHEKNKVNVEHVKYIIDGHVRDRCEVTEGIDEDCIKQQPDKANKIHLICFVVDGSSVDAIEEGEIQYFKQLKRLLLRRGISLVTVVTKIDQIHEDLGVSCEIPYMKICLKRCLQKVEDEFALRRSVVFPVRNYVHEHNIQPLADALLCDALRQIVHLAKQSKEAMDENSP